MKLRYIINILPLLLFPLGSACSSNSETENTIDLIVEKTVLNETYGNNSKQNFDIYLPTNRNTTTTKTLVLIHGGSWVAGDKEDMNYLVPLLKQSFPDYAIVNMNYRLASAGNPAFPMQLDDITSVLAKLKNSDYGISENIGFIGASAGAHLSLLYGYGFNANNKIKMICSIVGPTNFTDENYLNNSNLSVLFTAVTGIPYQGNETYYQELSPVFRATTTSPPTIMFYGNADPLIPTSQGIALDNRLTELNVYHDFYLYNGGHGDWSATDQLDTYTKLVAFISLKF